MALTAQIIEEDYRNSLLTKYVGLASYTVLIWDHIITFSDEFEYIWKHPRGLPVYLFLLNRYLIPCSFAVGIRAYFRSTWSLESCKHFVRFEGALTMIGITIVALMMFLRIRVLYRGVWIVQGSVLTILFTFIGVNSWLLTNGVPVYHPAYPLVDSCTMIVDPKIYTGSGPIASSTAWLPLLYDTVVMSLTLKRTAMYLAAESGKPGHIFRVLLHEGLLYFSVICAVTLTFTLMIIFADQSVRNITGQLELCLTVVMMSRITLHLKAHRDHYDSVIYSTIMQNRVSDRRLRMPGTSIMVFAKSKRNGHVKSPPHSASPRGRHNLTLGDESFMTDAFSTMMTTEGVTEVRTWQAPESEGPVVGGAMRSRQTDGDGMYELGVVKDEETPKDMCCVRAGEWARSKRRACDIKT